jgi:hypothetical protein
VAEDLAVLHTGPTFVHVQTGTAELVDVTREKNVCVCGSVDSRVRHLFDGYLTRPP